MLKLSNKKLEDYSKKLENTVNQLAEATKKTEQHFDNSQKLGVLSRLPTRLSQR